MFRGSDSPLAAQVQQTAYAVLISISDNPRLEKADRDEALRAVELAWTNPREQTINALRAIGRSRAESQSMQVRALPKLGPDLRDPVCRRNSPR